MTTKTTKLTRRRRRKLILGIAGLVLLLALPFAVGEIYRRWAALPSTIVIATGPPGGLYRDIAQSLAEEIETQLHVDVRLEEQTDGSLDNLRLLRSGAVDLALYQPGTERLLAAPREAGDKHQPQFISNVYPEIAHWFVRRDAGIASPADLPGKKVAIGRPTAGDYAMSRLLLEHFGLSEQMIDAQRLRYAQIRDRFASGELDAAFITVGAPAPILAELAKAGHCELKSIPNAEALTRKFALPSSYTIPAGMYDSYPETYPPTDIKTIAVHSQLLTHDGVDSDLVEEVTRILLSEEFLQEHRLGDLFNGGTEFATHKPEFPMHAGAVNYFDPELKPLLPTDFVEATEGMRSFLVSSLIALFLLYRWYVTSTRRRKEHWLDQCIQSLLDIERRQVDLDQRPGTDDVARLQKLLDEVTDLRQGALRKVSAHDLSEDRAADCFLEMCHALSDKINAKITRQRLERRLDELARRTEPQS